MVYLLNMTWRSSPKAFPEVFSRYPASPGKPPNQAEYLDPDTLEPKLALPLFFHFRVFRDDLMLSYMLGIGVDQQ
jgi:hypothetical protein